MARSSAWVAITATFLCACGSTGGGSSFGPGQDPPGADDAGGGGPHTFAATDDGGGADAAAPKLVFYANTDTALYQLDPDNLSAPIVPIGPFDCVGASGGTSVMTDIAVDEHGNLFGVSPAAAWPLTIQGNTVHCEQKWPLAYGTHFNGLTFAPEDTVAPHQEVLIGGNSAGEIYRIDPGTGASTEIGTLGTDPVTGLPWGISGDMVFLANGGNPIGFATARTCTSATSCAFTDTLLEIDVKALKPGTQVVTKAVRGKIARGSSCANAASPAAFGSVFGIVALHDKVYGFSHKGDFIEIADDTGEGCLSWNDSTLKFAGGGVTTIVPVTPPPPK